MGEERYSSVRVPHSVHIPQPHASHPTPTHLIPPPHTHPPHPHPHLSILACSPLPCTVLAALCGSSTLLGLPRSS